MILLSRIVTRLLWVGLLVISILGITTECLADGQPNRHSNQCSNFAITEQWCRFTFPETFRAAHLMVGQAKSAISEVQRLQELQDDWVRKKMDLVVNECRMILDPLVSTLLTSEKSASESSINLTEDENAALAAQALAWEESEESNYWSYYQDCQRWDVELTRAIQQHQIMRHRSREVPISVHAADAEKEKTARTALLADERSKKFAVIFDVLNRTSQWLGQTFRQIEFSAIESSTSSPWDISRSLY